LTGVIIDGDHVRDVAYPRLEDIKHRFFGSHPDDPICLHRKELIDKGRPYHCLRDAAICARFDAELLQLLSEAEYTVITAVIDKLAHLNQYKIWQADPYHYCLEVLVERYVMWLKGKRATGDVMAEARNKNPDKRLKKVFSFFYKNGTSNVTKTEIANHLTSGELKLKPKSANICGLQFADLIAGPSASYVRSLRGAGVAPSAFGGAVVKILVAQKYRRSRGGTLMGWGIKWLP
jgi:hypothetical protein